MLKASSKFLILFLFLSIHSSGQLVINEIIASNKSFVVFDDETPDLIEIYNTGIKAIQMKDYCLSNNPDKLTLWSFPDTAVIQPKGFLLLFADKKNTLGGLHTNFKLKAEAGFIALTNKISGNIIDSFEYSEQQADISYGRVPDGSNVLKYMNEASPGQSNNEGFQELLLQPDFSHTRGFYDSPFDLTISSPNSNATILYTLDGSEPLNVISGATQEYRTPLAIETTSYIRARLVKEGSLSSDIVTHTYIFLSDVINQAKKPEGFPTNWAHTGKGDYEMDPKVVNDSDYSNQIIDNLKSIPTVSLVMNKDDLFGTEGIYLVGENIEKAVSTEFISLNNSFDFHVNCGVTVFGGTSIKRWKSDKLSMRLKFKSKYGPSKLNLPLYGDKNPEEFNTIVLDATSNNCWHYGGTQHTPRYPYSQRAIAQYTRDQFTADLQNAMGGYAQHGFYVHLYLNGLYWGIYNLHERPDENFAASYLGGNPEDYDILKHSVNDIVNGNNNHFWELFNLADNIQNSDSLYTEIEKRVDILDFINYMILNYYLGNSDWSGQNWYASYNREIPEGKWRFHSWDAEHIMESKDISVVGKFYKYSPTHLHQLLMNSENYKQRFADAVQMNFYTNGVLTPENITSYYEYRVRNIIGPIVAESARWGDNHRLIPFTRDKEWEKEYCWIYNTFFPNRRNYVIEQFRNKGWFPSVDAPLLKINSNEVNSPYFLSGDKLQLQCKKGIVYYTNSGIDPRTSDDKLEQSAIKYESQLTLDKKIHLTARTYLNGIWSAKIDFQLYPHNGLIIDEIYYHAMNFESYDKDNLEYITLKNISNKNIDLSNAYFVKGINFIFPEGSIIHPNSTLTLASNSSAFQACYQEVPFNTYEGKLNNSGEELQLLDKNNNVLANVNYSNTYPWPDKTDGKGYALKYAYPPLNNNSSDPINWSTKAVQALIIDEPRNRNGKTTAIISYPNPAQTEVNLTFYLKSTSNVELSIFNFQGQLISNLTKGNYAAGQYSIVVNLLDYHIPSGIYIVSLKSDNEIATNKLVVIE